MSTKEVAVIRRPRPDQFALGRYRAGTDIADLDFVNADLTADTTCSCCTCVMSWKSGRISERVVSNSVTGRESTVPA
jgi:hypothetical protein